MGLLLSLYLVSLDVISVALALLMSVALRFDFTLPPTYVSMVVKCLPVCVLLTLVWAVIFRLYTRLWRYAGSTELLSVVGCSFCSGFSWFLYSWGVGINIPRGVLVGGTVVLLMCMGGSRLALRLYNKISATKAFRQFVGHESKTRNVLIVGAGDAGAMIAREILYYHKDGRRVVGFIDDSEEKAGKSMLGVKIFGGRDKIGEMVAHYAVEEIIIAMPSVKGESLREVIALCQDTGKPVQILPGVYEIINGEVHVSQLRNVEIGDLLGRKSVELDNTAVRQYLTGKVVLVTGAGGSIGSEVCRQVAKMQPAKLLLLGRGENSVYEIWQELLVHFPDLTKVPIIADIRDKARMEEVMATYKPQVIFHAAAHKHVPLMEYQPIEAIKNNVWGTKVVAEAAAKWGVETFVMISTDKAVNPTSVMGCTKRVSEMYVQSMNAEAKTTRYVAVRFGNVLGSRGSVVPLFKRQIAAGGPVTVTHPEMKRYFMTIPEASQLVLQAGAMAQGGEVYVLDMGEPIKIADLARDMIRLSGLEVDKDIKIVYTGLRPGEKLFEELLGAEDGSDRTVHDKIYKARIKEVSHEQMDEYVQMLLSEPEEEKVIANLMKVVPTYHPNHDG